MQEALRPRLDVLPPEQRALWPRLVEAPDIFTLYGGTAIALQLGHRQSVDFDFFACVGFDPADLLSTCGLLAGAETLRIAANTLTVRTTCGVLLSFFGLQNLRPLRPALQAADTGLPVASLPDLGAAKALAVQSRAAAKDYIDLVAVMQSGFALDRILSAAMTVYGPAFNPVPTLKALAFFDDGDLATLPPDIVRNLTQAVAAVNPGGLKPMPRPAHD